MKRTIVVVAALCAAELAATRGTGAPGSAALSHAARVQALSAALGAFRADFDVVDDRLALPASFAQASLVREMAQVRQQALREPTAVRQRWLAQQRATWTGQFRELRTFHERHYQAHLYVSGVKICWSEPSLIAAYDGKERFIVTNPGPVRPATRPSEKTVVPFVAIVPGFSLVTSQLIPFYGALHPRMPMFSLAALRRATPAAAGWWAVHPSDRWGNARAGLVRFDLAGHVADFKVYMGDRPSDEGSLLERWAFSAWRSHAGHQFPGRIQATYFSPAPFGVRSPNRTARARFLKLSLLSFSAGRPADATFTYWHPAQGSWVFDQRYEGARAYQYGLNGASARLPRRVPEGKLSPAARQLVLLLAGLTGLLLLRSSLRRTPALPSTPPIPPGTAGEKP